MLYVNCTNRISYEVIWIPSNIFQTVHSTCLILIHFSSFIHLLGTSRRIVQRSESIGFVIQVYSVFNGRMHGQHIEKYSSPKSYLSEQYNRINTNHSGIFVSEIYQRINLKSTFV